MYAQLKRLLLLVTACVVLLPVAASATPMTAQDQKQLSFPWHDTGGISGSCTPADDIGDVADLGSNVKTAFVYFTQNGYSAPQSSGLVGNFMYESTPNMDPTALNSIGAYGIAQWLGSRLTTMRSWVRAQGMDPSSLDGQLKFVVHELNTTEGRAKADLLNQKNPNDAAKSVFDNYERAGDSTLPDRQKYARTVYSQYSALAGDDGTALTEGSGNPCSGSTSPDCTSASGTAKILCAAKAYEGIYYRWGGGHQGYDAFVAGCPNPSDPPNNQASGSPSDPTNGGASGNPSPCATDCSGLVTIAVDTAFNKRLGWTVGSILSDGANWKSISKSDIQPGDVLTQGDHHVEIVDHYNGGGSVTTFGSHRTGTKTGNETSNIGNWSGAYRYVGPQE